MKTPSLPLNSFLAALAITALISSSAVQAAPLYWDGNGTTAGAGNTTALLNKIWGTDSMWNSDSTGGAGGSFTDTTTASDDLFFVAGPSATSGQIAFNPTVTGTQAANSITFQSQGAQTLSGGTAINLGAGGLVGAQFAYGSTNRGTVAISSAIALQAGQIWINNATTAMSVSGAVSGTGNLVIQNSTSGTFTISTGGINNSGTITNSGSGGATTTISAVVGAAVTGITQNSSTSSLFLTGANATYAGTTTLTDGILRGSGTATNNLSAFGTGGINLNGGTLQAKSNGNANGGQTIITGNGITGNNVTMGSTAATVDVNNNGANSSNNITFGNLSVGTGQLTVTGGNSYSLRFSGTTTLTGNATFNPTTAGLSLVGAMGDGGNNYSITKIGSGTLTLAGANTYTGTTSVLAGTLSLSGNAPSGSAGTLGNATSDILLGDTAGSSNAMLNANGDFTVGRNIVVQGGNSGIVTIGSTSVSVNSSTFSGDIALGSGGFAHNAVFSTGDYHGTIYSGTISGTGGITTIAGQSTSKLIINGNNTFSGGTTITTGVLRAEHNNALGTGAITINGGTLGSTISGITLNNNQTWAGNFSGGLNTFGGTGKLLTTTGTNTISGGDRIIFTAGVSLNINGTIEDGGNNYGLTFRNNSSDTASAAIGLGGSNTFGGGLTIVGAPATRTLTVTTSTSTATGSGQTSLTNASGSILKLANALSVDSLNSGIATPTITGGTGYTNGTQNLIFTGGGGGGATGTATIAGGIITSVAINSYGTGYTSAPTIALTTPGSGTGGAINSSFGSSSVNLQANELTFAGTNASPATYAGIISGAGGSLVKNGSGVQTLTGANTYTGSTTVNAGTLLINGTVNASSGVAVNGGTFEYSNNTTALDRAVTVAGGSFRYNSTQAYSGALTFTSGTVGGSGNLSGTALTIGAGQALSPGNSPGTLNTGAETWANSGSYLWEINALATSAVPGTEGADPGWDFANISGTLAITAGVGQFGLSVDSLVALDNWNNASNYQWRIATASGGVTGFSASVFNIDSSSFADQNPLNGAFSVSNVGNDVFLNYTAVPEPSTWLLLAATGTFFMVIRRRRRM